MYKDTDFPGANLASSISKYKEHRIYDIRLATTIGSHDGCEALCMCVCVCVCMCVYMCVYVCMSMCAVCLFE